jgi:very-short-patch-repair endonuclease
VNTLAIPSNDKFGDAKERLLELLEFGKHAARLVSKTTPTVRAHRGFCLFEHECTDLPGVRLNSTVNDGDVWLSVARLYITDPPDVRSTVLRPWLDQSPDPVHIPALYEAVPLDTLAEGGQGVCGDVVSEGGLVNLQDYSLCDLVRSEFDEYVRNQWKPWAEQERLRRQSIDLYSRLFKLKQQLDGGIIESPIELVWGVGVAVWQYDEVTTVTYPLLTKLVEIRLDERTAELQVLPRAVPVQLELDWYTSVGISGVKDVENTAREFLAEQAGSFSPFIRESFEDILRSAATHFYGIYLPQKCDTTPCRSVPRADENLQITDTWVVFARPRTNNILLQDLDRLTEHVKKANWIPPAISAIVSEPDTETAGQDLPDFRGVSTTYHRDTERGDRKTRDLFFPKPYNPEQERVIQLLETSDGVVVQGPPGTGKTHTIANIISHYLAEGKRILVSSMKEPALSVIQEQIPESIRPLTVSLLSSDYEGMQQFEHAIQRIAREIQTLNRSEVQEQIRQLEDRIDGLHRELAIIDRKTGEWFRRNLRTIEIAGEKIDPLSAAREVMEDKELAPLIPDRLGLGPEFTPQFTDEDVMCLRKLRKELGKDIVYADEKLPHPDELPGMTDVAAMHRDLATVERLDRDIARGDLPAMADANKDGFIEMERVLQGLDRIRSLQQELATKEQEQVNRLKTWLVTADPELITLVDSLGVEIEALETEASQFLRRPVEVPSDAAADEDLCTVVSRLASGKRPFGLIPFGKSTLKRKVDSIRVVGRRPTSTDDWAYVMQFIDYERRKHELVLRWNALATGPLHGILPVVDAGWKVGLSGAWEVYRKVKESTQLRSEPEAFGRRLFPQVSQFHNLDSDESIKAFIDVLSRHLVRARSSDADAKRRKWVLSLSQGTSPLARAFYDFFTRELGDLNQSDEKIRSRWKELSAELARLTTLRDVFATLKDICRKIEASGAPEYALLLRTQPTEGPIDRLLPDNWCQAWRLRQLAVHLESLDGWDELKRLAESRKHTQTQLSHCYEEVVACRAWLRVAENATPKTRQALQAYLNAISKVGKGTGPRAYRYRQQARIAAQDAYPAVPCWIMTHYRVSESLPAEMGVFDLVIVDEASQSDLTSLPTLLRGKKVLIVGDDKQVSPAGIGIEEGRLRSLMGRFLTRQIARYAHQMSPERSIYDLYKVVFASNTVMLREHFRCAPTIIEYSKREFYDHGLIPLRIPKPSERIDPPLVDILVEDGYRNGDINEPEARVIVEEIKALVSHPELAERSIGVVSLLGFPQARLIWELITQELEPEIKRRHRILCGDARTFQGNERDIVFLSMVVTPNDMKAVSGQMYAQRFNVAGSRARDRMYLVRSVHLEDLSQADELRRGLIQHFQSPFKQGEVHNRDYENLFQSQFEREVYNELAQRGYRVIPQVRVGKYSIDLVVEGDNDARLAIECDGDAFHGPDQWAYDIERQRVLERAGWRFWRCFASSFYLRRQEVLNDLLSTLHDLRIEPVDCQVVRPSIHTEHRIVDSRRIMAHGRKPRH